MCFWNATGTRLSAVVGFLAGIWLDVRQNVSGASDIHASRRRCRRFGVQGQNAARHAADIAGVRPVAAGRAGRYALGGRRSDATAPQQSDVGD